MKYGECRKLGTRLISDHSPLVLLKMKFMSVSTPECGPVCCRCVYYQVSDELPVVALGGMGEDCWLRRLLGLEVLQRVPPLLALTARLV